LADGEVLGIEDQVETEDNDTQSQQDQGEESDVGGNEEGQVAEEGTSKDVDGSSEEGQVQTGGEGVEQEGDDQEENGGDKEGNDSLRVREESQGVCEQEGKDDVCEDIDVASSEPVSLEIHNHSQNNKEDSAGNTDPFLSLDPLVGDLGGGFFNVSSTSDGSSGNGGSTNNIFKSEEPQCNESNEVLDSKESIEFSEEDHSGGGSFIKELAGVRKVINDMVAHRIKEFR